MAICIFDDRSGNRGKNDLAFPPAIEKSILVALKSGTAEDLNTFIGQYIEPIEE